jgi:hypothetical protein
MVGCGDGKDQNAVVQGRVTIDGQLAEQGTVTFHPQGGGAIAYGTIHKDGSFAMQIGQGRVTNLDQSEIYPGKYIATVVINAPSTPDKEKGEGAPPIPGVRITSAKFSNKDTSGLNFTIKPGLNVIDIPVERATPEEIAALTTPSEEESSNAEEAKEDSSYQDPSDADDKPSDDEAGEEGGQP